MKKISNIIYILCFLLILAVPLCFTETAENVRSEYDNRLLAELPEAGDADFSGRFESYLRDRIGFRSKMMDTYQMLNDRIAGELTHPIYTYGAFLRSSSCFLISASSCAADALRSATVF